MGGGTFFPVNQVRLTNVCVVRMKKKGKRFEIACYKNKVVNWRNKVEKDIDEVLQTHSIFTNVSRGVLANQKDLMSVFGTTVDESICRVILEKGDLQVSERERQVDSESRLKEIATIIADKCICTDTQRPFPVDIIEQSLKDVHFSLKPNRSSKQQAIDVIPTLKTVIAIERAQMRLFVQLPKKEAKQVMTKLTPHFAVVEEDEWNGGTRDITALVDPGAYRVIEQAVAAATRGNGTVEIVDMSVVADGDVSVAVVDSGGVGDAAAAAVAAVSLEGGEEEEEKKME